MFKFLIEGKTIKELKANVDEFFREFEALQPSVKVNPAQDISAHFAAKLPEVPIDIAPEVAQPAVQAATVPHIPSVSIPPKTPTPANDYGLDTKGLPWDERIHAVTQATVKDGSWRYKRGVEESTIKTVEAELIERMKGVQAAQMEVPSSVHQPPAPNQYPGHTSPAVPVAHPVVQPPPIAPPSMNHLNVVPTPVAVVAPPPMPPPQPAVPSAHTFATFKATLIPTLAKLVKDGKLTHEYQKLLCDHYGVDMLFKVNDEQLAEVFEGFVQYGMIVKA